jgi:hypothetical protein
MATPSHFVIAAFSPEPALADPNTCHAYAKRARDAGPLNRIGCADLTNGGDGGDASHGANRDGGDANDANDGDDGAPSAPRSSPAWYRSEPQQQRRDCSTTTPVPVEPEPRVQDMRRPPQARESSLRSYKPSFDDEMSRLRRTAHA